MNMMIKKIIAVALTITLFSGCQKYLDLDPLSKANGEKIWGTALGSRQLLAGNYSLLRRTLLTERPFYLYSDLPSGAVLVGNSWTREGLHTKGNFYGAYLESYSDWSPWFKIVTTSNTLLNHIDDVPAEDFNKDETTGLKEKMKIKGEAHFLYAYTYFWLTRIHGDVPLIKESIESVDQALSAGATIGSAQSPQKDVLEYCLKHINAAIVNLDYDAPTSDTWAVRADKAAALSLKADICLWLANHHKGEGRYTELVEMADESLASVIAQGGRTLVDYNNPEAVNNMFEGQSSEGIFELNVSIEQNETYWMNYADGIHAVTWWTENYTHSSANRKPESNLIVPDAILAPALYPELDIRREIFIANFGNTNKDTKTPPMLRKYSTGIQEDPNNKGAFFANSNVMLMRLSGIILLRAEALCKLGRSGNARTLLNEIRNRSGIGNFMGSDGELLGGIFDERARELVGEGHSAFDRIRCEYWIGCEWYTAERIAKKGQYWPVNPALFSANRDLVQVPWWSGKV